MRKTLTLILTICLFPFLAEAKGTSGALTLSQETGSRSAALRAFIAGIDEITALAYNPASLRTLSSGQASFLYEQGIADDGYANLVIGAPWRSNGWGIGVGYYNGGDLKFNDGLTQKTVNAQTDVAVTVGYAFKVKRASVGLAAKYLSSELAETASAKAYAGDIGILYPMHPRFRVGASVKNLGTKIKYLNIGDELPSTAGPGAAFVLIPGRYLTTLYVDLPYDLVANELRQAAGLEFMFGPIAVRGGFKSGSELEKWGLGAGFMLGRASLDYAFGLVDKLDSRHRVSLAMRFGGTPAPIGLTRPEPKKAPRMRPTLEMPEGREQKDSGSENIGEKESIDMPNYHQMNQAPAPQEPVQQRTSYGRREEVYEVRRGDSLGSIAQQVYGDSRLWKKIYTANKHLIDNPADIEVGQKIIIP